MKMKSVVVLCLVYASLVSAGFFTPSPEKHRPKDDVRVDKEKVVIGIEDGSGNTKVKISPHGDDEKGVFASAKEKIKEASSNVVPDGMKKGEEEIHHKSRPGEVVCDAYGKCKEKITSYIGRTKEAAEKAANEAEEQAKEGVGKVKEKVAQATHKAYDNARGTKESVGKAAEEEAEAVKGRIGSAKESVARATQKAADRAKERVEDAASEVSGRAKEAEKRLKTQGKEGLKGVPLSSVLHLLGFATAYGMCVWVTFGSSYVLAKALPRQQLAVVQSRLYPVYFKAMASTVGMALLGSLMDRRRKLLSPSGLGMFRGFNLLAPLLMILVNMIYLEPRATQVLFERMRKEKEEGGDAPPTGGAVDLGGGGMAEEKKAAGKVQNVRNLLGRLNSYSSLLNIMTLMSLTWHLVHLGRHLHAAS